MNQPSRIQLRRQMTAYFSEEELQALCFDLGIDHENLPYDTKEKLVIELVRHAARHQQIESLLDLCRRNRPQLHWPDIPSAELALLQYTLDETPPATDQRWKDRQKQLILLEKVKQFWVKGVLERSTGQDELLPLTKHRYDEAIDHPWHEVVGTVVYDTETLTTHTEIYDTFVEADRALLILGSPGSGKTTILINLARVLIDLAEQNASQPIPVILNLASWAENRPSLADWVIEELAVKYQIPRQFGRAWVTDNVLTLLLDGLDEVPGAHRSQCVAAINQYRLEHGLTGLAVTSRSSEYEAIATKLKFGGAVVLQTLTPAQIDGYLTAGGPKLAQLRTAVQQDEELLEMAQSPLMLNVMVQAYGHADARLAPLAATGLEGRIARRNHIFAAYVAQMFRRRVTDRFSQDELVTGLSWLADKMSVHNQAVFLVEQIQPSWLPTRPWRWFYVLLSRWLDAFFISLVLWIYLANTRGTSNVVLMFQEATAVLRLPSILDGMLPLFLLHVLLGLLAGLVSGFYLERRKGTERASSRWQHIGLVTLTVGIATVALIFPFSHPLVVLAWGGVEAGLFGLAVYFLHGDSWRNDIHTTESLSWSWRLALMAGLAGAVWGIFLWFLGRQVGFYDVDLPAALSWGLIFFLLAGLQGRRVDVKNRPNEGMLRSGRNGVIAAVMFGIVFALFYQYALNVSGRLLAGLLLGVGPALIYGGGHVLNHILVRLILVSQQHIPPGYSSFLDEAAEHVLIYKVGGGYIFIHRLLQEYFASLESSQVKQAEPG